MMPKPTLWVMAMFEDSRGYLIIINNKNNNLEVN
jgi:hypothetical protein